MYSRKLPNSFCEASHWYQNQTKKSHTHTHRENRRPMLLNLFSKASKLILCGITLIPKSDKEITDTHTHTHTHKENCRPKLLINIEQSKWSGLRHQLLLRACFPVVSQMGLLCLSLDVGRNEAKSSLWLLALLLHLGRSKGNWTDHKAFRGVFEALSICNPRRSRPLNLSTSSAGGTLRARGPNPTFLFPLPSSHSLTTSPERKGLQIPNFSIPHRLAEY